MHIPARLDAAKNRTAQCSCLATSRLQIRCCRKFEYSAKTIRYYDGRHSCVRVVLTIEVHAQRGHQLGYASFSRKCFLMVVQFVS